MDTLLSVISVICALIVLGIIIMTHELGHYSVGRACDIKIVEFAVGFGPKIKKWVKNDIIYSIRWFFIGGFTKFYGEDEDVKDKRAFNNQPAGRRALTIAAGPVFNMAFAFLLVIIILCAFGDYVPVIQDTWEGSPAEAAGLRPGDRILEMNGVKLDFWMELQSAKDAGNNYDTKITVLRDGKTYSYDIINAQNLKNNEGKILEGKYIGIDIDARRVSFGFFQAIALSFKWMFLVVRETVLLVLGLFAGRNTENVGSVVMVVSVLGQAVRSSFENVLRIGVAISVSLAVMNLLPLPALDGGRLVFIGIEKLFGKPVPRNVEGVIHFVGFTVLIIIIGLLAFRDFTKIFGG